MIYAIILAGGSGTRMGNQGIPKQFLTIQDKPIVIHTLENYINMDSINKIIIVCHKQYCEYMKNLLIEYKMNENISITEGGRTRMESIISGINFLKNNNEISHDDIFISTDSVRPIVRKHEIQELIKKAQQFGASTIVTPIIENIVKINENDERFTSITENILKISALNKSGIDELYEKIAELFNLNEINLDNEILITNIRHKNIISKSLENVNKAKEALEINMPIDIITIYIKEILEDLGEITGEVVTEDIINEIFSKFCLGK